MWGRASALLQSKPEGLPYKLESTNQKISIAVMIPPMKKQIAASQLLTAS